MASSQPQPETGEDAQGEPSPRTATQNRMAELEESIAAMDQETLEKAEIYAEWLSLFTDESGLQGMEIDAFVCPFTYEIMRDPVICADGHTYERAAIERWFRTGKNTSPKTNLPLAHRNLIPNITLRQAIEQFTGVASQPAVTSEPAQDEPMIPPPRNQCAVLALRRALQGIHTFGEDQDPNQQILAGLTQVDETLPDGDRATQAGFTDAAITGYLTQLRVNYRIVPVSNSSFPRDQIPYRARMIFNVRGHWMSDIADVWDRHRGIANTMLIVIDPPAEPPAAGGAEWATARQLELY
eukprot:COSAG03_NODE_6951_length_982_cov_16.617946_1_plen_296_part_10